MNVSPDGSIDPREFRAALGRFASGVTIVTTEHEGQTHGMTANAFVSVSLDPPLVLVSVDRRANLHRLLALSGRYGVSILAGDQQALSDHFAGRGGGPLEVPFIRQGEVQLIAGAVAHLVVRMVALHPAGDHTLYVGQVEYLDWRDGQPLVFFAGQYHRLDAERPLPSQWLDDEMVLFSFGNF